MDCGVGIGVAVFSCFWLHCSLLFWFGLDLGGQGCFVGWMFRFALLIPFFPLLLPPCSTIPNALYAMFLMFLGTFPESPLSLPGTLVLVFSAVLGLVGLGEGGSRCFMMFGSTVECRDDFSVCSCALQFTLICLSFFNRYFVMFCLDFGVLLLDMTSFAFWDSLKLLTWNITWLVISLSNFSH